MGDRVHIGNTPGGDSGRVGGKRDQGGKGEVRVLLPRTVPVTNS